MSDITPARVREIAEYFSDCTGGENFNRGYDLRFAAARLEALEMEIGQTNDECGVVDLCQIKPLIEALREEIKRLKTENQAKTEWIRKHGQNAGSYYQHCKECGWKGKHRPTCQRGQWLKEQE